MEIGRLLDYYFSSSVNTFNYLLPIAKKGAKNTLNIGNTAFLDGATISLPTTLEEQQSLARLLSAIEQKVILEKDRLALLKEYEMGVQQLTFL
jgi:restriction endonuclease S subunit